MVRLIKHIVGIILGYTEDLVKTSHKFIYQDFIYIIWLFIELRYHRKHCTSFVILWSFEGCMLTFCVPAAKQIHNAHFFLFLFKILHRTLVLVCLRVSRVVHFFRTTSWGSGQPARRVDTWGQSVLWHILMFNFLYDYITLLICVIKNNVNLILLNTWQSSLKLPF